MGFTTDFRTICVLKHIFPLFVLQSLYALVAWVAPDCDTCRWMAPDFFKRANEQSAVLAQPQTDEERQEAYRALLACPTCAPGFIRVFLVQVLRGPVVRGAVSA